MKTVKTRKSRAPKKQSKKSSRRSSGRTKNSQNKAIEPEKDATGGAKINFKPPGVANDYKAPLSFGSLKDNSSDSSEEESDGGSKSKLSKSNKSVADHKKDLFKNAFGDPNILKS